MSLQVEQLEHNMAKLTIEVSAEELEGALQKAYQKQKSRINVPGFRKGKVPRQLIEKMYGPEIFYDDAANALIPEAYSKAYDESGLEIVSQPKIDVTQIEKGKPFIFTAEVATKPEVELGEYKGIEVPKYSNRVTQKEIDAKLEEEQLKNARTITVEGRPVQDKDEVVLDFEGFVDGEAFEGGKAENYDLEIGSNSFIPGFEDQVIGTKIDEEKDINVKFPEEYFSKELAGKDATFKVKVHAIKKKELPKLDDEFAKEASEFDTLKELKASIKERLEKENEEKQKYETEEAVVKAVTENIKVEVPSGMIETEVENMIKDIETRLSYQGIKFDQYLQMLGKTMEEMKKEYEPQAEEAVKTRLMLEAVIKAEKIEANIEEIDEKIKEMAKNYGKENDEAFLQNENVRNYIEEGIKSEKAVDFLVKNAKMK